MQLSMELSKANFAENLNTKFWLKDPPGERTALDLVEVREGKSAPRYETFTLIFRGDPSKIHPQRTYPLEHATIGEFDLFLVPVGRDQQGTMYEAVFNRTIGNHG